MRRDGIKACCQAMVGDEVDFKLAKRLLCSINHGECYRAMNPKHITGHLQKWWEKWDGGGGEADAHRSGRPVKVPDNVALEAAKLLGQGTWYVTMKKGNGIRHKRGYSSIAEACLQLQRLQQIKQQYRVDNRALLAAVHRVAPTLRQHTVYFKYEFDKDALAARLALATQLLQTMPAGEAERAAWLQRMVWMDEGGIAMSDFKKQHVKVWAWKGDTSLLHLVHAPHIHGQKETKVHFFVAVTSHPAFAVSNGLVHWDFTTGTTDIRRHVNTQDQTDYEAFVYPVSHSARANTVLPYASVYTLQQYCSCCCNKITCCQPIAL
jgi:hypothetical protein